MKRLMIRLGSFLLLKGGVNMVTVYVTLIIHEKRTFESVPKNLKPAVEAELLALGLGTNGKPLPEVA